VSNGEGSGIPLDNVVDHCAYPVSCDRDRDPADFFSGPREKSAIGPAGFSRSPGRILLRTGAVASFEPSGSMTTPPTWLGGVPPDRFEIWPGQS
jgi:hypothetical protein